MAYATNTYVASAGMTDFGAPVYLDPTEIKVYLNGQLTADWTWFNPSTIRLNTGASDGDFVRVVRETDRISQRVTFQNGPIPADSLNLQADQDFYLIQELFDLVSERMAFDYFNWTWNANGYQFSNIPVASEPDHVITKYYMDNVFAGDITQAVADSQAAAAASQAAASDADADRIAAQAAASDADADRIAAANSAAQAAASVASVNLPAISQAESGKILQVNAAGNGYQVYGFSAKNFFINGCARVAQRAAVTISGAYQFGAVDRWRALAAGTGLAGSFGQITPAVGAGPRSGKAVGITGFSCTGGVFLIEQRIESKDSIYLYGRTITVSALIFQDTGSNVDFFCALYRPNSPDDHSVAVSVTSMSGVSVPSGVWTRVSWTTPLGSAAVDFGLRVQIYTGTITVTNKTVAFGELQLEIGNVRTDFEYRPLQQEIAACQRYFEKSWPLAIASPTGQVGWRSIRSALTGNMYSDTQFRVVKRAAAAVGIYSPTTGAGSFVRDVSAGADVSRSIGYQGEAAFEIFWSATSGSLYTYHWSAEDVNL